MRGLALILGLALLTTGCLGLGGDGDDEPTSATGEPGGPTFLNDSQRERFSNASDNATYLQNADYSDEHIHDYWNGADQRVLMDEVLSTNTLSSVFITAFWPFIGGEPRTSVGTIWFTLPNATFVPEGTGELVFEIDATGALQGGNLVFAYRAANTDAFVEAPGTQPAQASWTIELEPEMADLPHATSTRWYFRLDSEGPGAVLDGDINIKITAKRLFDIEAWPEHPDFWQQGQLTRLDLANLTGTYDYQDPRVFWGDPEQRDTVKVFLPPGTIVPPETEVLLVTFHYERDGNTKNTLSGDVELAVKEGSTAGWYRGLWQDTIERGDGHRVYAILVDERSVDSPYAAESGWGFEVHAFLGTESPVGDGRWNFGIAEVGSGSFNIEVQAFRVTPDWLEQAIQEGDGD